MDFFKDDLGRRQFADVLSNLASNLAVSSATPAGRVIAVDAPWGSGKSWIAQKLPEHFKDSAKIGKCVYVDAFKFDYHQDPFAVVTSAIIEGFAENDAQVSGFKKAAIDVIKVTLPAIGKGLLKASGRAVGIDSDEIADALLDSGADASEKAIEKMLNTFADTRAAANAFQDKLRNLASTCKNGLPLVVVIDELDRCRPSFALEMLERVKHLFDVPNVVFIFFLYSPALHSAIRKTYGHGIEPAEYLRKFISVVVNLPVSEPPTASISDQINFFDRFLAAQYPVPTDKLSRQEYDFRNALTALAPVFKANFRDIEAAMFLFVLSKKAVTIDPLYAAYCFLLKIMDVSRLKQLQANNHAAFILELERLDQKVFDDVWAVHYLRGFFLSGVDRLNPEYVKTVESEAADRKFLTDSGQLQRVIKSLELEYIRA